MLTLSFVSSVLPVRGFELYNCFGGIYLSRDLQQVKHGPVVGQTVDRNLIGGMAVPLLGTAIRKLFLCVNLADFCR